MSKESKIVLAKLIAALLIVLVGPALFNFIDPWLGIASVIGAVAWVLSVVFNVFNQINKEDEE